MTFQELLKDEREEERRTIAERMLRNNVSVEDVIMYTGMTKEQLRDIKINMSKEDLK